MEINQMPSLRSFCESELHLSHQVSNVSDGRKNVIIPSSTVYDAVLLMGALGLGSLLGCDQILRTPVGQKWFSQNSSPTSDSTMSRSLETMYLNALRPILYSSYRQGVRKGVSKCNLRCGDIRIGIVDGTSFGQLLASCIEIVGPVSLMVDLQEIEKRGKELPASYTLLRRVKDEFGERFVDIILGDALYLNAPFFNLCLRELKCDVLVKTDDSTRDIIKDAMGLFREAEQLDIPLIEEVDAERMRSYKIMMDGDFRMNGVDEPMNVAWIREEDLRTGDSEEFWAVASSKYLSNALDEEEMRELVHLRWDIENNGFKDLNQTVHTKHLYSHDSNAQQAVLLILFTVFNLLGLYLFIHGGELTNYPGMKQTKKFAILLARCMLMVLAFLEFG